MRAIVMDYKRAFETADDDHDGLLQFEGLKKFFQLLHVSRTNRGLPSKDPAVATEEQW